MLRSCYLSHSDFLSVAVSGKKAMDIHFWKPLQSPSANLPPCKTAAQVVLFIQLKR